MTHASSASVELRRGGLAMRLTADEFRVAVTKAVSHQDFVDLVHTQILGEPPTAFDDDPQLYPSVQAHIASRLALPVESVRLVGSGAMGYSIAPNNFARPFHRESDLDFAVVSEEAFDATWDVLLRWAHHHRVPASNQRWFAERQQDVFWGWMMPEKLRFQGLQRPKIIRTLQTMQAQWFEVFQQLSTDFPGTVLAGRDASARLYRSEGHIVHYQVRGLKHVKRRLEEQERS